MKDVWDLIRGEIRAIVRQGLEALKDAKRRGVRIEISPAHRDQLKYELENTNIYRVDTSIPTPPLSAPEIDGLEFVFSLDGFNIYCNPQVQGVITAGGEG
jgi:hypothetical protein